MPPAAVQRKACDPETPTTTEPSAETPLALLVASPASVPRSAMPPPWAQRNAWGALMGPDSPTTTRPVPETPFAAL